MYKNRHPHPAICKKRNNHKKIANDKKEKERKKVKEKQKKEQYGFIRKKDKRKAGANKAAIDLMMGHKSADVGERIYTHKSLEELLTRGTIFE